MIIEVSTSFGAEGFCIRAYGNFVLFLKAYYEWLEQTNNVTDRSKNLLSYTDIDNTTQEFKWVGTSLNEYTPKAFSGIQIIHDNYFKHIKLSGKFSLIDAYLSFDEAMPIMSYDHSQDILLDVGKPESLEKATALFK